MKALITGISGFLGSHLCEHLLACGDQVLGLSRAGNGMPETSPAATVAIATWDLAECERPDHEAEHAIAQFAPDCIFHLAAQSVPRYCGQGQPTEAAWNINVRGTERVIALAQRLASSPRLILASSGEVYARPPQHFLIVEDHPLEAHNAYAATKLAAEAAVRHAVHTSGLNGVIVRSFQHAGPRQDGALMMAEWAKQLVDDQADVVRVHSLNVQVDVSDVRDACRGYRLLALHGARGEAYNLGSGTRQRTGDILQAMCDLSGTHKRIVEQRPGVRHNPIADCRKLRRLVDWHPQVPILTTAADTLAWWKQQRVLAASER